MKFVDPIKEDNDIAVMYRWMIKRGHIREAHLWAVGCNVALRISDLLQLTFDDVKNDETIIREKKTKKLKDLTFNKEVIEHVKLLREFYKTKHIEPKFLFESTSKNIKTVTPISASWMNRVISEAGEAICLDYNVGTHTMRKTWAYRAYRDKTMDFKQISETLNHSSEEMTRKYIGITKSNIKQGYHDNAISVL